MSYRKILVANRGEIACRVMRTARALCYRTVAVHSDADATAPHVAMADEAVRIGPPPAAQSYLNIDAVLDAARRTGAGAVHPGYGFLSENAAFARACEHAGLVFIGPPAAAIAAMGDKAGAKRRMAAAGVPVLAGYLGSQQDDAHLAAEAGRLGYPLLVKAVAGGGGRGIRQVGHAGELAAALAGARREALSAFGDGTLMLERLVTGARHIEIQVFADALGNAVHLGERDCTLQRRRQKVIEEAPSPAVTPAMREAMGRDAVAAALAVGYRGAGTVEFIVDDDGRHWFLEMNTRLQVEHPVTEMITGLDLVEWQLRIAAGEALPLAQDAIRHAGHAIEARLYAEDPYAGFAPQTGRIAWFRPADALRPGVRIDAGVAEGDTVTPFYDNLLAKVIAHGTTREEAVRRLLAALEDLPLLGLATNARLLCDLLSHQRFATARLHTGLLDEWAENGEPVLRAPQPAEEDWQLAAALLAGPPGWRPAGLALAELRLCCGDAVRNVKVGAGDTAASIPGATGGRVRHLAGTLAREATVHRAGDRLLLARGGTAFTFREAPPLAAAADRNPHAAARASVAGTVIRVDVGRGDRVVGGQVLAVIEAMKMELRVTAPAAGIVSAVRVEVGRQVAAGATLVELAIEGTP